jgi:hypothetical protein
VELITLSSVDKITEEREDLIEGLFPDHEEDPDKRPYK